MDANKEIVDWLSLVGPNNSFASIPDTAATRQQPLEKINCKTNSNLQFLQDGISETIEENATLGKEFFHLINKLHISPQSLPGDIKKGLKKVSMIMKFEELSDLDETALLICRERKKIHEKKQCRQERELKNKYELMLKKYASMQRRLNQVQEAADSIEDTIARARSDFKNEYSNNKLLCVKLSEYKLAAEKLEAELHSLGVKELEPDRILDKYKTFVEMKGHLAELNQVLRQYGDLPPNLLQAKYMVEAKELEYKEISQKFMRR